MNTRNLMVCIFLLFGVAVLLMLVLAKPTPVTQVVSSTDSPYDPNMDLYEAFTKTQLITFAQGNMKMGKLVIIYGDDRCFVLRDTNGTGAAQKILSNYYYVGEPSRNADTISIEILTPNDDGLYYLVCKGENLTLGDLWNSTNNNVQLNFLQ